MRKRLRLILPAAAVLALGGCTGYSPPPRDVLNCQNMDPTGGNFAYLNCLRNQQRMSGQSAPQQASPTAGMAATAPGTTPP